MFSAIISGYRFLYLQLASLVGYGWAIVVLSFICSFLMLPLMRAVAGIVRREKEYEDVIDPQVAAIKAKYTSDMDRHLHIQRLYARYGYSPLSPIKKVLPLFVQIPFLLLTYYMLKGTAQLAGVRFLFLSDLGQPDALIPVLHANLLPLVMTGVNIVTVFATPGFTRKDWTQAIAIAVLFLALLYTAPSALLLYWTLNNVITMVRTLAAKKGEGVRLLSARVVSLRNSPAWLVGWLTVQRMEALSLGFLLASVCMGILVYKEVWFFNCYVSRFMVCPTLFAAIALHALALRRERKRFTLFTGLLVVLSISSMIAFLLVVPAVFFAPVIAQAFTHYVNPLVCFGSVFAAWVVIGFVLDRFRLSGALAKCLGEAHWLLFSIALAIHYSFSSELVKLPLGSVLVLAFKLVVPAAVFAALITFMFAKRLPAEKTFRIGIAYCTAIYLIPMISLESGKMLAYYNNLVVRLLFIGLVALAVLHLNKRKPVLIALCLLLAMAVTNAVVQRCQSDAKRAEDMQTLVSDEAKAFANAHLLRANSVYLLVYDSYSHDEILKDLGIKSRIRDILLPRGFTRYDAYSVGSDTVQSMGNSFAIGNVHQGTDRSMMAGNNPLCDFLRRSGYKTSYLLCAYDMPGRGERMPGDFYFPAPQKVARLENVLLDCILYGYLSQAANTFNSYSHDEWTSVKADVLNASQATNTFVYAHNELPGHANANVAYRKSEKEEIAAFAQRLIAADKEIEADVDAILRKKDDALIIVASDHGAFLKLCARGDYGRLDLLDRCGIQLYVRWPRNYKTTLKLDCLTNVFLETLICLSGDSSLSRFESEGVSLPIQAPLKAPAGAIKRGVVQMGRDKGKSLFSTQTKTP